MAAAAAAAATTATAWAFHITRLSLKPLHSSLRPLLPSSIAKRRSPTSVSCLISGVDGGGVSDDFVSTRKSGFDREFSVISNMLKRIEPLDTSVISKGVSDFAKDSMKQTISTMLGLLPSDQFAVTVRVSKAPLNRLLVSSVITGYTLWNAEYRISLMRNFDLSPDYSNRSNSSGVCDVLDVENGECESGRVDKVDICCEDMEGMKLDDSVGNLSSEEMDYIQRLECEIANVERELHAQKKENLEKEITRSSNNDLLEYLRSLDSDMVTELSRPSSSEVEEVIQQLVQNIMQRFFKEENSSDKMVDSAASDQDHQNGSDDFCDTMGTSRDYLAKLLFWCMLLGHHLRGLENRVHLSCAVGLL